MFIFHVGYDIEIPKKVPEIDMDWYIVQSDIESIYTRILEQQEKEKLEQYRRARKMELLGTMSKEDELIPTSL